MKIFNTKVIRVIANASINPEAGSALALSEMIVDSLLKVAETAAASNNDDLLLPTLAALNNLSFYSIVRQKQTYASLKQFLHCANTQVDFSNCYCPSDKELELIVGITAQGSPLEFLRMPPAAKTYQA